MDEYLSEHVFEEDDDSPSYDEIMSEFEAEEEKRIAALAADPLHRVLIFLRHVDPSEDHSYVLATWSREAEPGRNCTLMEYHESQGDQLSDWLALEGHPTESGFWIFDGEFVWEGGGGEHPEWELRIYGQWRRPTFFEIVEGLQGKLGPRQKVVDHDALSKGRPTDPLLHTTGDALAQADRVFTMEVVPELNSFASTGGTRQDESKYRWVGRVTVATPDQGKLHVRQWLSEPELRRRAHRMLAVADELAMLNATSQPIDEVRISKESSR